MNLELLKQKLCRRQFVRPLFFAILFYLIWEKCGPIIRDAIVQPWVSSQSDVNFQEMAQLDYGRMWRRAFYFLWTIALYFLMSLALERIPIGRTDLFRPLKKWRPFLAGCVIGAVCISSIILLSLATGAIQVTGTNFSQDALLSTIGTYVLAMSMTAVAEELGYRGFIVGHLSSSLGIHFAIWSSALFFGASHLYGSPVYALVTVFFGVIAGYLAVWHGIYCSIGFHFLFNFMDSSFFSGRIFQFEVLNPILSGARNIKPNIERWLSIPIYLCVLVFLLTMKRMNASEKTSTGFNQ
jgi:membrane protease YdiL (CAAX protease family)